MMTNDDGSITSYGDYVYGNEGTREGESLDDFLIRQGEEKISYSAALKGRTLVDVRIRGGFAVGSYWERMRGVCVEFTYL